MDANSEDANIVNPHGGTNFPFISPTQSSQPGYSNSEVRHTMSAPPTTSSGYLPMRPPNKNRGLLDLSPTDLPGACVSYENCGHTAFVSIYISHKYS